MQLLFAFDALFGLVLALLFKGKLPRCNSAVHEMHNRLGTAQIRYLSEPERKSTFHASAFISFGKSVFPIQMQRPDRRRVQTHNSLINFTSKRREKRAIYLKKASDFAFTADALLGHRMRSQSRTGPRLVMPM